MGMVEGTPTEVERDRQCCWSLDPETSTRPWGLGDSRRYWCEWISQCYRGAWMVGRDGEGSNLAGRRRGRVLGTEEYSEGFKARSGL